jgi:anti-sigma regulatory factor (Ser/Thr protein kinase)
MEGSMGSAFREGAIVQRAASGLPAPRFDRRLPADADRLGPFRHDLESFLFAHGVPESDVFDLIVAASEAAANAMEHPVHPTEPFVSVTAEIAGGVVTVTVRDTGQWRQQTRSPFRGRGLSLIGSLAHLHVVPGARGTTLTIRRQVFPPAGGPHMG